MKQTILRIILLFVDKSYIKIGTLICLFLVGPVAGFFLPHSQKMVEYLVSKK